MNKLLFYILLMLPVCCFSQTNFVYSDSFNALMRSPAKDTALVNKLNQLAAQIALKKSDTTLLVTKEALALAQQLHYGAGIGAALMTESKYQRTIGDYPAALQKGLQALGEYEKIKAVALMANAHIEIAQIYKDLVGQNQTSEYINTGIEYSRKGYNLFSSISDTAGMVVALNMRGILFRDKAKTVDRHYYDTSLTLYNQAFNLMKRSDKGKDYTGKLYNNISQVYLEYKHDYPTALEYLMKAVDFNTKFNRVASLSHNYGNISHAYSLLNDHTNSLKYARLMEKATLLEGAPVRIQNAYQQLYASFKAAGKMDSALQYFVLADSIDDHLTNVAKTQQVMNLQVQYETVKKESEINRLNKETESQHKRIAVLFLIIVLVGASAATMLWLYRRVKRQKYQIALQSQRLEMVMKELHHRVKNNLQIVSSLLSLQTYKLHDEETISIFKESQQRIQAMSLIHQRLYTKDMLTSVNMKEYITDLVETLLSSYGFEVNEFELNILIEKEVLDVEKALPIGLLINEMVTNSLKYAYKDTSNPSLTIKLTGQPEGLTLIVKDNGPGIDLADWKKKGSSFGKQLINVLGKQLRAQQSVAVENGTAFTLIIPEKAA